MYTVCISFFCTCCEISKLNSYICIGRREKINFLKKIQFFFQQRSPPIVFIVDVEHALVEAEAGVVLLMAIIVEEAGVIVMVMVGLVGRVTLAVVRKSVVVVVVASVMLLMVG